MRLGRRVDAAMSVVSSAAAALAAACGLVIVVLLVAEVTSRAVRSSSIAGAYELSELLLVALVFLGLAKAERAGTHVRSAILTGRLSAGKARAVRTVGSVVAALVAGWMATAATERAAHSVAIEEFRQGLIEFPVWPARVLVALGLWLLVIELFLSAAHGPAHAEEAEALGVLVRPEGGPR